MSLRIGSACPFADNGEGVARPPTHVQPPLAVQVVTTSTAQWLDPQLASGMLPTPCHALRSFHGLRCCHGLRSFHGSRSFPFPWWPQIVDIIITRHRDTGKPKACFVEFGSQVRRAPGCARERGCWPRCSPRHRSSGCTVHAMRDGPLAGVQRTPAYLACSLQLRALQDDLAKALSADGEPMLRRPIRIQVGTPCLLVCLLACFAWWPHRCIPSLSAAEQAAGHVAPAVWLVLRHATRSACWASGLVCTDSSYHLRCGCRWRSRRAVTALASAGAQWREGCCSAAGAAVLLCRRLAGQT